MVIEVPKKFRKKKVKFVDLNSGTVVDKNLNKIGDITSVVMNTLTYDSTTYEVYFKLPCQSTVELTFIRKH